MKNISRILVANWGEIAVRVIGACKDLGIESIVAVSEADKVPAKMTDRAVCIGPPRALDSYLNIKTLITAALERLRCNPPRLWFPGGECRLCRGPGGVQSQVDRTVARQHPSDGRQGEGTSDRG